MKMGKLCIEVTPTSKIAFLSEILCNGCGICTRKCPMNAIQIINLPKSLDSETSHRYHSNGFKLHRLPIPRSGEVLGLVGANGTGKTTALKILAGVIKPNLGNFSQPPEWKEIITNYRGSEIQNCLKQVSLGKQLVAFKVQHIDLSKQAGTVGQVLEKIQTVNNHDPEHVKSLAQELEIDHLLENKIATLSGGEAQRFAILCTVLKNATLYIFDEPSSYLDIRQRVTVANVIRRLSRKTGIFVIVIEHDLAMLDYIADFVCVLYGTPGAYGVVTAPMSTSHGLNIFLDGYLPSENMRFRNFALSFKTSARDDDKQILDQDEKDEKGQIDRFTYPAFKYSVADKFTLNVEAGSFMPSQISLLLGQNGTGKTTLVKILAGLVKLEGKSVEIPEISISYKPQMIKISSTGTVSELLYSKIQRMMSHVTFQQEVVKPLGLERLMDQLVSTLSGGEIQRVAIALCLGKPAKLYLIDEPSAYLDSEQRMIVAKIIRKFILSSHRSAFIVEHDFMMATYLADQIITFSGKPGLEATCHTPASPQDGLNAFLKEMKITLRRDATSHRPRINKLDSVMDCLQKKSGSYFSLDDEDKVPENVGKFEKRAETKTENVEIEDQDQDVEIDEDEEEKSASVQEEKKKKVKVKEREKGGAKNRSIL